MPLHLLTSNNKSLGKQTAVNKYAAEDVTSDENERKCFDQAEPVAALQPVWHPLPIEPPLS